MSNISKPPTLDAMPGTTSEKRQNLTLPLSLEEGRAPKLFIHTLYLLSAFIAAGVVWATVAQIKELTIAKGQLVPVGSVQLVQHLEGGIIAEIMVSEGQIVKKGAPLVRFQPAVASSDLGQVNIRAVNLTLQRERLNAMIDERPLAFGKYGKKYPELARDQIHLMNSLYAQRIEERKTLKSKIEQRVTEITSLGGQEKSLMKQISIQEEQVAIREDLLKEGFVSRAVYLEIKRTLEKTRAEAIAISGRLGGAKEALVETKSLLAEYDASMRQKLNDETAKISAELAELRLAIVKHKDRVTRLLISAPVKGIIQELIPRAIGEVMKPGDVIARIVPMEQELIAEVRIPPKDIGHISVGNTAEIKLTTFDPARFGGITGTVRKISATTFQDERGEPYYKAEIGLSKNYVGRDDEQHLVLPGMVVNAEIITGSKSLTKYLLKPVYRSLDIAFSER